MIFFNCETCGGLSSDKPSRFKKYKRHFCSKSCHSKWRKSNCVLEIKKGTRFGKLIVLKEVTPKIYYSKSGTRKCRKFLCLCDCGNSTITSLGSLRHGITKSCGCYKIQCSKETAKLLNSGGHGLSKTPLYRLYYDMLQRCFNKKRKAYADYGGRGITVCEEWRNNFLSFYNWAIKSGYDSNLELDRINNNGNYSPENCRWATSTVNANNKRNTVMVEWEGKKISLNDLCRKMSVRSSMVYKRIKYRGLSIEDAIKTPSLKLIQK